MRILSTHGVFMRIITISLLASFILLLFIESDSAQAAEYQVIIPPKAADPKNPFHFIPSDLEIKVLDTVIWENLDSVVHTVTSGTFSGGPDGLFNSGPLEPGDSFTYQFVWEDIGIVTYYCTIHPWMNSIIFVVDEAGRVEEVQTTGSLEAAEQKVQQAEDLLEAISKFATLKDYANSYRQVARNYHDAAMEYALLGDHQNAAKYHQESGMHYHNAALSLEEAGQIQDSVKHHYLAGVEYHNAALQFRTLKDYTNYGKQFAESIMHKRMAKYGSDYVLPPKHQMMWLADPTDISCKLGLELIFKSSNGEPKCLTPTSAAKLVQRGWGTR